jgi:hypothetical protein
MWRGGVSPLGSVARTIPVKAVVVGRATAESPGAGCGAGRDRMTGVESRGSSVTPISPTIAVPDHLSEILLRSIRPTRATRTRILETGSSYWPDTSTPCASGNK